MGAESAVSPGNVRIVDDDPTMLYLARGVLRGAGFEVEIFESPHTFLSAPPPAGPTCAVLDLQMPELDGLTVMSRLASRGDRVPVIVLSGQGDVRTSVRAMKQGAVDYLCKPVPPEELIAAVRKGIALDVALKSGRVEEQALRSRFQALTSREHEVCEMAASGLLNKQIADALGLHERTVKLHRSEGMRKLGAGSITDVVRMFDRLRAFAPAAPGVHSTYGQSTPEAPITRMARGR